MVRNARAPRRVKKSMRTPSLLAPFALLALAAGAAGSAAPAPSVGRVVVNEVVDTIRYDDRAPWPVSADSYSASLERICPTAPGDAAENWTGSPLPAAAPRPAGTPGKPNAAYSAVPLPVVDALAAVTPDPAPG